MGEANWLSETSVTGLLAMRFARDPRKRRLVGCAAVRRILVCLNDERQRLVAAVEAAERFADGEFSWAQMKGGPRKEAAAALKVIEKEPNLYPQYVKYSAIAVLSITGKDVPLGALELARYAAGFHSLPEWKESRVREEIAQVAIARDIFGNPFCPVALNPSWRSSTAAALAQQMYDSRDFGVMPILGDALEDAGCDSDEMLAHCRDASSTHVRGCWVVDLVLGKS